LDCEHSELLTHDLATLAGKKNDATFGGNTMDTPRKKIKRITFSSTKTLEDLTTRLEDLMESETTVSQTVSTNLKSVMLKADYDEDLAQEWVSMSHLYIISLLGFQYYVGLHTHLWKIATTYIWQHTEFADGSAFQRGASDTSDPWDPPPSGVYNLYLPLGPKRQKFPFLQNWGYDEQGAPLGVRNSR
jgi:hypothetical protein